MKGLYSSSGIYLNDEKYVVSGPYKMTSTDYEIEAMLQLKAYCDENGINLLYVNAPIKYTDDTYFADNFGLESYGNRNADLFLSRLDEKNINYIDLRTCMQQDGMNSWDMFYRTDHHWTTVSGLWAAKQIAIGLNDYCNYNIDISLYDSDNYQYTYYDTCWLGEQGRKVSAKYIGLDNYIVVSPLFDTDYIITDPFGNKSIGNFNIMINYDLYNLENNIYTNRSWHYSYLPQGLNVTKINNNLNDYGNILYLGDSYSYVVVPFLSLGVSNITGMIRRECRLSLYEYLDNHDIDTIVLTYAEFMIGAHDDPNSANYKMFEFNSSE